MRKTIQKIREAAKKTVGRISRPDKKDDTLRELKDRRKKIDAWLKEIHSRIENDNGGSSDAYDRKRIADLNGRLAEIKRQLGESNIVRPEFGRRNVKRMV